MVAATLGAPFVAAGQTPSCEAPAARVWLDHVVVGVADLASASEAWRAAGFTLKEGRLHANGLLNRHAKLGDGTEIELMSVARPPADRMAQDYAAFIAQGDGGAYLALRTDLEGARRAAEGVSMETSRSGEGAFGYLVPTSPRLASLFLLQYAGSVSDADSILTHQNGAAGLAEVRLEADPALADWLVALGGARCQPVLSLTREGEGVRVALANGIVEIVPPVTGQRPRVLGVLLRLRTGASALPTLTLNGIEIRYRP